MRLLRLILALLRCLTSLMYGLVVLVSLGVAFSLAVVVARIRRDEKDLADAVQDDAAITQRAEEDETADKERRWFLDLGPEGMAQMIRRVAAQHPCYPDPKFRRR